MLLYQNGQSVCFAKVDPAFRRDVLNGLASRPRTIPARWFYDRAGSELFEAITALPEYYVARTERALLCSVADEVAALAGPGHAIVEFGSGL
jgi:L-histidine N-alpha-methyltransferase